MKRSNQSTSVTIGNHELIFESGKIARQANGAVTLRVGDTMLFSTACASSEPLQDVDFLPLKVDYQEKFSSVGKTIGGFIKREGRPTQREILVSRLIDRPLRPMFEDGYYHDTQVLAYIWSYDGVHSMEPLAICAASAALVISDIPLKKPIGAVRMGLIDDAFIVNPTVAEMERSKLDLILAGTEDAVLMIEGYCDFLTEDQVLKAIEIGHESIKKICHALTAWQKEIGKSKNLQTLRPLPKDVLNTVTPVAHTLLEQALKIADKQEREKALSAVKIAVEQALSQDMVPAFSSKDIAAAIKKISSDHIRKMILHEKRRPDGRATDIIRNIDVEQTFLPRVHGSSLFTRGETQALVVCTLGGESMAQRFEDLFGEGTQRFYLQYFFPPFSVGEVGRLGAPGRREIGHGKLAERALQAILPSREEFPYIVRLESNITESNGSSSMASVCGGCLSMMDAGVPIKRPVAGIAMGLILEEGNYVILSDILGIEDSLGDMDFKITGDDKGITAFQMDIKVEGITIDIMRSALEQAKNGRVYILKKMLEACPTSKQQLSMYAPRIECIRIHPSKIATVIGPGGKQIRAIIEETKVEININDDGTINLASNDLQGLERAKMIIQGLTADVEIGKTYSGKVTSVAPFGIFVEIIPGKEGLCHISEFDLMRINDLNEFVKAGDMVNVKVLDINERGQIKLSRKILLHPAT